MGSVTVVTDPIRTHRRDAGTLKARSDSAVPPEVTEVDVDVR